MQQVQQVYVSYTLGKVPLRSMLLPCPSSRNFGFAIHSKLLHLKIGIQKSSKDRAFATEEEICSPQAYMDVRKTVALGAALADLLIRECKVYVPADQATKGVLVKMTGPMDVPVFKVKLFRLDLGRTDRWEKKLWDCKASVAKGSDKICECILCLHKYTYIIIHICRMDWLISLEDLMMFFRVHIPLRKVIISIGLDPNFYLLNSCVWFKDMRQGVMGFAHGKHVANGKSFKQQAEVPELAGTLP